MKQGTGNRQYGDAKVEPTSRAKTPGGASNLGMVQGNHTTDHDGINLRTTPLDAGRGFTAPGIRSITSRKGGSQGKY